MGNAGPLAGRYVHDWPCIGAPRINVSWCGSCTPHLHANCSANVNFPAHTSTLFPGTSFCVQAHASHHRAHRSRFAAMAANASSRPQPEEAATQADAACDLLRLPHSLWGALWAALQGDSGRITPEQHNLRRTCRAAATATAHLSSTCHLSTALRPCPPVRLDPEGQSQQPAAATSGLPCGSGTVRRPAQLLSASATMSSTDGKLWAATAGRLAAYPQARQGNA